MSDSPFYNEFLPEFLPQSAWVFWRGQDRTMGANSVMIIPFAKGKCTNCVRGSFRKSRNCPRNVAWDNTIQSNLAAERVGLLNPFNLCHVPPEWFIVVSWKYVLICTIPHKLAGIRELATKTAKGLYSPFGITFKYSSFFRIKTFYYGFKRVSQRIQIVS